MESKWKGAGLAALALVVVGALGARQSGMLGATPGEGADEDAEGKGKGKDRGRRGTTGAAGGEERVGGQESANDSRDAEPTPEPGSYAYAYRTAKAELEMAKHDLAAYRESSKWPESARPAEEMAAGGGLLPHHVAPTSAPLSKLGPDGKPDTSNPTKSRGLLVQDRFQLVPGETVTLEIHAISEKDKPLPVRCISAKAIPPFELAEKYPAVEFPCTKVDDQTARATFDPAKSPLKATSAHIGLRVEMEVTREDGVLESGGLEAGVHYVATSPGRLTGVVREAYENGSLAFYLGFEAAQPGFYRLNVRADSGQDDKVFAHMNIRQSIDKPGPTELRAELFGKLVVDNDVRIVRLRDIDGEFVPPAGEIANIPGRDGVFHVVKAVDRSKIKGDEWSSPEKDERTRHYEEVLKKAQDDCDKNYDGCTK